MRPARLVHLAVPILIVASVIAIGRFADGHVRFVDVTRDSRNSLNSRSAAVLALLRGPLHITVFVPEGANLRAAIGAFLGRYQRRKPDIDVRFVDPRKDLATAHDLEANAGETVLEYEGRRERLTKLDDGTVTNALARLARGADRWVTFLAHNGERRVARSANRDLSSFATFLEQRGLRVREYAPGRVVAIPDNTSVLVIASPQIAYLPDEIAAIERYVAGGGNVLWLTDPDGPSGLTALQKALGFRKLPGTIVDPVGLTKFRNPAYAMALDHATHPITNGFDAMVAFPYAAALEPLHGGPWQATTLVHTGEEAWTETGPYRGNVAFDAPDEVKGALPLALVLTRKTPARSERQRVVVVGDGDFLSNTFVDNLGNRDFGRRIFEWLATDDELIDVPEPQVADALLFLDMWQRVTIFLFFGVGLPLGLAANGALRWWRLRHA